MMLKYVSRILHCAKPGIEPSPILKEVGATKREASSLTQVLQENGLEEVG